MLVATWNVNSLRARLGGVLGWLERVGPDVACLQETRVSDADFPTAALAERGYQCLLNSRGGYAGVAILARDEIVASRLDIAADLELGSGRIVRATINGVRLVTVYVPTRKVIGKVEWLDALRIDLRSSERSGDPLIVCGDFNICFDERDVFEVGWLAESDLFPERIEDLALRRLLDECDLVDLLRVHRPEAREYTWFDPRRRMFERDRGLRLDYMFANRAAVERCAEIWTDREAYRIDRPSDHLPVCAVLEPAA